MLVWDPWVVLLSVEHLGTKRERRKKGKKGKKKETFLQ